MVNIEFLVAGNFSIPQMAIAGGLLFAFVVSVIALAIGAREDKENDNSD